MSRSHVVLALLGLAVLANQTSAKEAADDPVSVFKKAYDTKDEAARIAAIGALASIQSKVVVEALYAPLTKDPSIAVRKAAAKAIGAQWSPTAPLALTKALKPDDAEQKDVTIAIIAALGATESDAAVPALVGLLKTRPHAYSGTNAADAPLSFTAQAIAALKAIGSVKGTDELIDFLAPESASSTAPYRGRKPGPDPLMKQVFSALQTITGENFNKVRDWQSWWEDNKTTVKTFAVFRCETTGKTFDKITASTKCPQDGDEHPHCGIFLKTRCADAKPAPEKKAK
jgi:HEAT repeat protein